MIDDSEALGRANEAYKQGKDWFDGNERTRLMESLALHYSEFPQGSRYNEDAYKKRSRLFRPKTRTAIDKLTAGAAIALFSNSDLSNIRAEDATDAAAVRAAKVQHEIMNYRLNETMPWFSTCMAAWVDTLIQGRCFSRQEWVADGENPGAPESDTPSCVLIPRENIMWHPAADWMEPLKRSPYVIERVPWVGSELAEAIERNVRNPPAEGSGGIRYRPMTLERIMSSASDNSADTITAQREGGKRDRYTRQASGSRYFGICWVHKNIMRIGGVDIYYETLGETILLSEPMPLEQVIGVAFRPYTCGMATMEPHKMDQQSVVSAGRNLQEEINDNVNLRIDNLRLAINQRHLVRRGASTDLNSLLRNVAGSVTMTGDPDRDVKPLQTRGIDGASFADQDRLNMDFDDFAGVMTGSTVGSARQLNETVGGMNLLRDSAGQVSEFRLRLFVITWVQPTMRQILELTRTFETDPRVIELAGKRAKVEDAEGQRALSAQTKLRVTVGFGDTTPEQRIAKISGAFQAIGAIVPQALTGVDSEQVIGEIMGAVGFDDGTRFFPSLGGDEDPRVAELTQQIEQLTAMLEGKQLEQQTKVQIAEIAAKTRMGVVQAQTAATKAIADLRAKVEVMRQQQENLRENMRLAMEREALSDATLRREREFNAQLRAEAAARGVPAGAAKGEPAAIDLPGTDRAGTIDRERFGGLLDAPG